MPNVVGINFGAGYCFTDKIRVGLLASVPFTNQFRTDLTQSATNRVFPVPGGPLSHTDTIHKTIVQKPKVISLFMNAALDFAKTDNATFFIHGAVGLANISNKVQCFKTVTTNPINNNNITKTTSYITKTAKRNNVAAAIGFGSSVLVSENVHLDFVYTYRIYGVTKSPDLAPGDYAIPVSLKQDLAGSHISAGIRFDI